LKKGVSNGTANLSVKIVSMAFHAALKQGKIKFNPCVGLDTLPEARFRTDERNLHAPRAFRG
jgi:hypothetical protein